MSRVPLIMPVAKSDRVGRYPKHTFNVREMIYQVTPFMIAPVLPGETLENLFFESRVVSDPIKNKLIGWKKEYYFFYVKVTDLLNDAIRDMFIDPANTDISATLGIAGNNHITYTAKGGVDYVTRALTYVTQHWFYDWEEPYASHLSAQTNLPYAQIKDTYWMDTLTDKDLMPEGGAISTATDAGDLDRLMDAFEQLRALGLANMTYEDFLRSYGIPIPSKDENKPEMLCRFSDFQYPTNTIDPLTGTPTSAVSWVFKNGERKPKFFKEPGFILGVSVTRPKFYYSGLAGGLVSHMTRAWDWMPNYLRDMPETSLKNFATDTGPLGDRTTAPDGYWVDMNDLLMYGDQFQNHTPFNVVPVNDGANHMVNLPDGTTFAHKYIDDNVAKSVFKDTTTNYYVRQDGYVSLTIKGAQRDTTTMNFAQV